MALLGNPTLTTMYTPQVNTTAIEVLSSNWYTLRNITFELRQPSGQWVKQSREAYDRGNGATILLYNREQQTVILTRQFRMPTYLNGNATGMLIEACAGLLEQDDAEACIRRETEEETGYRLRNVQKVLEAYMSPGSVTELLYFFVAEYTAAERIHAGGGVEEEQEHIEVLELPFAEALHLVQTGGIRDGKTVLLLQYAQLHALL